MLSEELRSIHIALGEVLGKLDPDGADLVRQCRRNLNAAAEQAVELENRLVPGLDAAIRLMDRPPLAGQAAAGRFA